MTEVNMSVFDVNPEEIGSLPSFDLFPTGDYTRLEVEAEIKEINCDAEGGDPNPKHWKFLEVTLVVSPDSECIPDSKDDKAPKAGDRTTLTYDLERYNKKTGKVQNVAVKHVTVNEKDSSGSFANLMADWEDCLEQSTPLGIAQQLLEGLDSMDCRLLIRTSKATNEAGEPYTDQQMRGAVLS